MKKLPIFAACVLSLSSLASSVQASDINYDYAEVGYALINDFDASGGVVLSGSYDVFDNINVIGSLFISTSTDSTAFDDIDITTYSLGFGYHTASSDTLDFFVEARLLNTDTTATTKGIKVNQDDTGSMMSFGVRTQLNDKVELLGRIDRRNTDALSETVFTFGGHYERNKNLSFGLEFNTGADNGSEILTASMRRNF